MNSSIRAIITIVSELGIPKDAFCMKEMDKDNHNIHLANSDQHFFLCGKLRELKIQYFTYTPKHLKTKSLILKGIRGDFSEDSIRQEIEDLRLPNVKVLNLSKFVYNKNRPDTYHHLIQISNDSKTCDLFKIRVITYQRVRWEYMKKPSIFQCKNCQ